jgi:pimeloyl-ACP methyl ester carboxylesterase
MIFIIGFFFAAPFIVPLNYKELPENFSPFENSRFIYIEDIRLHYRDFKPDSVLGNILFVHGFSGSTFSWRNNSKFLVEQGYRVVSVDLPAFGYSDKSPGINHSNTFRSNLLWNLLDSLANNEKWILSGHSMGAATVSAMGAMRPFQTDGIMLVSGGVFSPQKSNFSQLILKSILKFSVIQRWTDLIASHFYFNTKTFNKILTSAYGHEPDKHEVLGYLDPFLYERSASSILDMSANSKEVEEIDINKLKEIPLLIIWGEDDKWIPVETGLKTHSKFQQSQLKIIKNAGHCSMETHAEEFNKAVLEFIIK